jgi:hypothetical protein
VRDCAAPDKRIAIKIIRPEKNMSIEEGSGSEVGLEVLDLHAILIVTPSVVLSGISHPISLLIVKSELKDEPFSPPGARWPVIVKVTAGRSTVIIRSISNIVIFVTVTV